MIYFSLKNNYFKKSFPEFTNFVIYFKKVFSTDLKYITINNFSINLYLKIFQLDIFFFLKKHHLFQYKQLSDIIVIDSISKLTRFVIVYSLVSLKYNIRVNVYCPVPELQNLPTVTKIYASAQ
jgi:NADH:ubiquinone oxidoreductase subunit C